MDLIGEKVLHVPGHLVRKLGLGRRGDYDGARKVVPMKFEIVRFVERKGIFHGYISGKYDRNRSRQRRLWMKVSKGVGFVRVDQIGTVKEERKIPFRSRKRKTRSPFGRSRQNVLNLTRLTPISKKCKVSHIYGKVFDKEDSPHPSSSLSPPPTEEKLSWMRLPISAPAKSEVIASSNKNEVTTTSNKNEITTPSNKNEVTTSSTKSEATTTKSDDDTDTLIMNMLRKMREQELHSSHALLESHIAMPKDHFMYEILTKAEHDKIKILRQLTSENFTQTGSIPVPDAPEPVTIQTRSMDSEWTTKRQRVALLRCKCVSKDKKQKERYVGYITWIEFTPRDSKKFVPPPVVVQIYVSKSHRGSGAPHGGHFGKRMFEWVARRTNSRCDVLGVTTPNQYSRAMLRDCGWYCVVQDEGRGYSSSLSSLPSCVTQSGDLYLRFSSSGGGDISSSNQQ